MASFLAEDALQWRPTAEQSHLPFSEGFLAGSRRYFLQQWLPHMSTAYFVYIDNIEEISTEYPQKALESLPDHLLARIFRRVHPVDRIRSASSVCKRWNRVLYEKDIWTQVALSNVSKCNAACAKAFLQKVSGSLKRLYISKMSGRVLDVIPDSLPIVTFCELCDYRELGAEGEASESVHYPSDLLLLDRCMPNLRCLMITAVPLILDRGQGRQGEALQVDLSELTAASAFGHLESLALCLMTSVMGFTLYAIAITNVESFLDKRPAVQSLRIVDCCVPLRGDAQETPRAMSFGHVRRLSLGGCAVVVGDLFVRRFGFPEVTLERIDPTNLVFFEISIVFPLLNVQALRGLHSLEHLHFHVTDRWLRAYGIGDLFAAPVEASHFPSRLRYLRITGDCMMPTGGDILLIARNCPQLRALNCGSEPICGSVLNALGHTLRHLQFTVLENLSDFASVLDRASDPGEVFPELRFIETFVFDSQFTKFSKHHRTSKKILRSVFANKPNLVVIVNERFISYRWSRGEFIVNRGMKDRDGRLWEAMRMEEGWCCVRGRRHFYAPGSHSDSDSPTDRTQDIDGDPSDPEERQNNSGSENT